MWGKGGGRRRTRCTVLSRSDESPESRGSAKLPHDLFSDFRHWRSLILVCVFLSSHKNTPPVLFTTVMLVTAVWAGSTDIPSFFCPSVWLYTPLFSVPPLLIFTFLEWFFLDFISFSCLACARSSFLFSFAPLSSAPARRSVPNHVCTALCRFD